MNRDDKFEVREIARGVLDERFPEKYCPECKEWRSMVKFERWTDTEKDDGISFKCQHCLNEFVEELRKV